MLGIVLINYKTEDKTIEYVRTELSKIQSDYKLVIVNNSCTEQSNIKLAEGCKAEIITAVDNINEASDAFVLGAKDNLGYAKGNNLGADFLNAHFDIDYFLFTNNDLKLVDEDVVEKLIENAELKRCVGAIGPRIIGLDGQDQNPARYLSLSRRYIVQWLFYPLIYPLVRKGYFNEIIQNAQEGYYYRLMASFLLIRAEAFKRVGGFDPGTFLYGEELILTEQLKKNGYKSYYLDSVKIAHVHSQTISKYYTPKRVLTMQFESNLYYYRKYIGIRGYQVLLANLARLIYLNFYWPILQSIKSLLGTGPVFLY